MKSITIPAQGARAWAGFVLPGLAAALALAAAVIGALIAGPSPGGLIAGVETLSSASGTFLGSAATIFPLGFAFGAGMVSTVNPCGFAMLPAYLGLYIGSYEKGGARVSPLQSLGRALLVGGVVTGGIVVLFGIMGIVIGGGARSIAGVFPWIGLGIGVLLVLAGAWLLSGGKLYTALAGQAAARIGNPGQVSVRGYFLFGISYGTASLSCTLPIFLAVVGTRLASGGAASAAGQFVVYALGMGTVIMALTLGMALFKSAVVSALRRVLPYVQPASALLMVVAGAYIVFYWLTVGGLLGPLV